MVAVVAVDATTGQVVVQPEILTRGVVYVQDSEELIRMAKLRVLEAVRHAGPTAAVGTKIKEALAELIFDKTGRRPMVLPVVLAV